MIYHMDLQKILRLKFLNSPAVLSLGGMYLRTAHDLSHGLAKISSLKFLNSPAVSSSWGIHLRTIFDICIIWTCENLKS